MSMNIKSMMKNEGFAKFAGGAVGAVYATTVLKAAVRPAFIMADKKNDAETKKYTATKEFLYQAICLGIAAAFLPFFNRGGFQIAKKHLQGQTELAKITKFKEFKEFKKDYKNIEALSKTAKEAYVKVNGGIELGSFIGSIIGLTIVAPQISHKILHPMMKAMGIEKKEDKNVGKPNEIYLADAKVPTEKPEKINVNA